MQTLNIDEALRLLCERHDLSCISIGMWPHLSEPVTVYAHWNGGNRCASGHGKTVAEAAEAAIRDAATQRSPDIEIPAMEMVA